MVYRDVFASTKDKVIERQANEILGNSKKGDSFGLSGSYEIDYGEGESDEESEELAIKKKPRLDRGAVGSKGAYKY